MGQSKLSPASAVIATFLVMNLASCGVDSSQTDTQSNRTISQSRNDGSADARGSKSTSEKNNGSEASGEDTECFTFWLHMGHCESEDEGPSEDEGTPDGTTGEGDGDVNNSGSEDPVTPPPPAPTPTPNTPPADPNVVEFRIKAGTGKSPWNTPAEMVQVKVGQTLRIINDDTITHRMHTGGAPCNHGTNFAPGASFNCVVSKPFDSGTNPGGLYDHIAGPTARFYVKATN